MATTYERGADRPRDPGTGWAIAGGVFLALAGVAALAAPGLTAITASIFVGWLLVLVGVAGFVMFFRARRRRWTDLAGGVLSLLVGLFVLFDPLAGAVSLTLTFAVWLALRGGMELATGFAARGGMRAAFLLAGVVDVLLAVLLIASFPFPAVQAVGLFVGLALVMSGVLTIVTAVAARRALAAAR